MCGAHEKKRAAASPIDSDDQNVYLVMKRSQRHPK